MVKSKHPDYHRYLSMVQRCYNKNREDCHNGTKDKIVICPSWHQDNKEGFNNFANWFSKQLIKLSVVDKTKVRVTRKNKQGNYSPANCMLVNCDVAVQCKTNVKFSFKLVKDMRDYARINPTVSLKCIAKKFNQTCEINISRALRGITWKNVNAVSPPIKRKLNQYRFIDGGNI